MDSACVMTSSVLPSKNCASATMNGSSRAPNFDWVRRTPLATARILPCCRESIVTIRSASPSLWVRRTTISSR